MTPNALECTAVTPASGGFKRLSGNNAWPLAGFPLIAWTNRLVAVFDIVQVSAGDTGIVEMGSRNGASVPWLRPPKLAINTATPINGVLGWLLAECIAASIVSDGGAT